MDIPNREHYREPQEFTLQYAQQAEDYFYNLYLFHSFHLKQLEAKEPVPHDIIPTIKDAAYYSHLAYLDSTLFNIKPNTGNTNHLSHFKDVTLPFSIHN